ncbi:Protein of unknown function [Pyronema omphalodes CBS 100304]|uniref:Uncharacterized protein n=1 Tax=Pyronema omphalodes (strain CBS 100304) TaxID=1076935 RepID=U4LTV6_PYROM|nr:Protein of unknown function [Pyronema omphalodes CBS 100304]
MVDMAELFNHNTYAYQTSDRQLKLPKCTLEETPGRHQMTQMTQPTPYPSISIHHQAFYDPSYNHNPRRWLHEHKDRVTLITRFQTQTQPTQETLSIYPYQYISE